MKIQRNVHFFPSTRLSSILNVLFSIFDLVQNSTLLFDHVNPVTNKKKLKMVFRIIECFHITSCSHIAILVSQNYETAAMLVFQTSPVGVELFSLANTFFIPINLHRCCPREWKRSKVTISWPSTKPLFIAFFRNSGHALVNHVIATYSVTCPLDCTLECLSDTRCQSFNCADAGHTCEINDQSKLTSPNDFRSIEASMYYGPTTETVRHLDLSSKF